MSKPPQPAGDLLEALGRAWKRCRVNAAFLVEKGVTDENRDAVRTALEKQAKEIGSIAAGVA